MYKIMIGSVLPRPIAWVSTQAKSGLTNLAPFSFFTVASCNPPMVCFAPLFSNTEETEQGKIVVAKDTLRNIKEQGEFVVNMVSQDFVTKVHQSSAPYPKEISEFDAIGVTAIPSLMVSPPRVKESPINMECKLHQIVTFGDAILAGSLVIGEVVCVHFDETVYKDGHIDPDALKPVGRMAGTLYSTVKDRFQMPRAVV
jgi:flavin reductase (DIM6/NTAB) family NADH-FMN oxidoreductase RutF